MVILGPCSFAMEYDSEIHMSMMEGHSSALAPSFREGFANFSIVYLFPFRRLQFLSFFLCGLLCCVFEHFDVQMLSLIVFM